MYFINRARHFHIPVGARCRKDVRDTILSSSELHLTQNLYSFHRIEKVRHQSITRAKSHSPNSNQVHFPISVKHVKLLCVGSFSTVAHRILNKLVQRFFALILTISLYLLCLRSVTCLAWEILCLSISVSASCINSLVQVVIFFTGVGETSRHILTRIHEHLGRDRASPVFQHLQDSEEYRRLCTERCFSILDTVTVTNRFHLFLKDEILIRWD